jgi:hypothetical protein
MVKKTKKRFKWPLKAFFVVGATNGAHFRPISQNRLGFVDLAKASMLIQTLFLMVTENI